VDVTKIVIAIVIVVVAVLGIIALGLNVSPRTVTLIQTVTVTSVSVSTTTQTSATIMYQAVTNMATTTATVYQPQYYPPYNYERSYPCFGPNCYNWNTVTVYGWLSRMGQNGGCVNLYTDSNENSIKTFLINVQNYYAAGYVVVVGTYTQSSACGGAALSVISISPA
jgi:hypothetical protein